MKSEIAAFNDQTGNAYLTKIAIGKVSGVPVKHSGLGIQDSGRGAESLRSLNSSFIEVPAQQAAGR